MLFGALYWAVWRLVLPYIFKFRLVPMKEILEDGTVVTVVSQPAWIRMSDIFGLRPRADYDPVF